MADLFVCSDADLRALKARARIPLYKLAAACDINPPLLSQLLNGRIPLTPEQSCRIQEAIERISAERAAAR